jgi:hypothetical protein
MLRGNLQSFLFGATASLSAGYYFLHQDIWRSADLLSESVGSMVSVSASKAELLEKRVAKLEGEVAALKVRAAVTAQRMRIAQAGSRIDACDASLSVPSIHLRVVPCAGRRRSAEEERALRREAPRQASFTRGLVSAPPEAGSHYAMQYAVRSELVAASSRVMGRATC